MMSAETVARTVVNALLLPENTTVEKIVVMPSIGYSVALPPSTGDAAARLSRQRLSAFHCWPFAVVR